MMKKYSMTVQSEILRCVKTIMVIKNAPLIQLNVRTHGSFCLRDESSDQRDEREFLIQGRLFEKDVGQAVSGSQTS